MTNKRNVACHATIWAFVHDRMNPTIKQSVRGESYDARNGRLLLCMERFWEI